MTSHSEGSYAIEASTRRLATSKRAVRLASKNLEFANAKLNTANNAFTEAKAAFEAARTAFKIAQDAQKSAKNEVNYAQNEYNETIADMEDAKNCLEEANRRFEVVDLLDDSPLQKSEVDLLHDDDDRVSNKKRRAVSLSPNDQEDTRPRMRTRRSSAAAAAIRTAERDSDSRNSDEVPNEIEMKGCGMSHVNGIYKIISGTANDNPAWYKRVEWEGKYDYIILRKWGEWYLIGKFIRILLCMCCELFNHPTY